MSATITANSPLRARDFLGTLGVDTHIAYTDGGYANVQNVIADLKYLGITQVRDGISNGVNGSAPLSSYIALAQAGIRFAFIIDVSGAAALKATLALIDQVAAAVPGSVIAIEGPNEINNQPVTYNGVSGLQGALNQQADIYAAVHADAALGGVPVYYFTGYAAGGIAAGPDPSTTPGLADFDNQHPYPNGGQAPGAYVARSAALGNENSPVAPAVYTETGYTTVQVNADVQAKYELDLLMDTAKGGIAKTFLYELMDAYAPGSRQGDAGYGLFDYTTAPKEVATALHDLTAMLQDNGAGAANFVPAAFTYSLTGLPSTGNSLALEKSDGTDIVAVWSEPQIWNSAAGTETSVAPSVVTVGLPATYATVQVFDPLLGTAPIATYANVSGVSIGVTDHPILIAFGGSASPVTPPPVTPPVTPPAGADTLVLNVSETAMGGKDAQFTVSVDGTQIGGTQTVTAARGAGAAQNIVLTGTFGAGAHTVAVTYLDGFTGNPADYGRMLYLNAITFDNATSFPNGQFGYNGAASYTVRAPSPAVASNAGTADTLTLSLAQTAVGGQNAQFMVSVDGQIVGGVQTVTASHAAGQSQNVTLSGNFGAGAHSVAIDFLNGFSGAAADVGRLLYVNAITLDGAVTTENTCQTYVGAQSYRVVAGTISTPPVTTPVVTPPTVGVVSQTLASDTGVSASDGITSNGAVTLTGTVTGAAGTAVTVFNGTTAVGAAVIANGNWNFTTTLGAGTYALYAVAADPSGNTARTSTEPAIMVETAAPTVAIATPAGTLTAVGAAATVTLTGTVGGAPGVAVRILDGTTILGAAAIVGGAWTYTASLPVGAHPLTAVATDLAGNTTVSAADPITVVGQPVTPPPVTPPVTPPAGADTLVLNVSETAMGGKDAQFTVSVDGTQIGGTQTVTAARGAGAAQNIVLTGTFGAGAHTVAVTYLDGFTGNPADYGRMLYLNAITFDNATSFANGQFGYNGAASYTVRSPSPAVASNAGTADTLTLSLAQTAVGGQNAQFMVSVDGQIVGGVQTVTASHAAGQSQNVTLSGNFGAGAHSVAIDFLNGFSGAAADVGRLLYVNAITLDGAVTTENTYQTYVGAQSYRVVAGAQSQAPAQAPAPAPVKAQAGVAGDTITVDGLLGAAGGVAQMRFLDGTAWTASRMRLDAATAAKSADPIAGTPGNDIGDRQILDVDVPHTKDRIVVDGWFGASPSARLAAFLGGDVRGLDSGLTPLLSAMAPCAPGHPGFSPGAAAAMPADHALQTAIAAAWHA